MRFRSRILFAICACVIFYLLTSCKRQYRATQLEKPVKPTPTAGPTEYLNISRTREEAAGVSTNVLVQRVMDAIMWDMLSREEKLANLAKNPIYRDFRIHKASARERVTVLLVVSSAPARGKRRDAIRRGWWRQCVKTKQVR